MAKAFFSIPTDVGVAALSNAMLLGNKVDITHIAVGDGNGSPYQPTANMLTLKRELWRGPVVKYEKEAEDVISISGIIPYNVGGFIIREMAVFDSGNNMIAIANTADLPKVTIDEGMSFDLHIKMRIHISNAEVIDVKINPHVTIATLEDVAKKTDKVAGGIVGNLTELDATGNLVDSGVSWEKINEQFRSLKEKKVSLGERTPIPSGSDLDTYKTIGGFCVEGNITAETLINSPFQTAFVLDTGNATGTKNTPYISQTATEHTTRRIKSRMWDGLLNKWYPWSDTAYTERRELTLLNGWKLQGLSSKAYCAKCGNIAHVSAWIVNPSLILKWSGTPFILPYRATALCDDKIYFNGTVEGILIQITENSLNFHEDIPANQIIHINVTYICE